MFSLTAGLLLIAGVTAFPGNSLHSHGLASRDTNQPDPVPGQSPLFATYLGKQTPLQAKYLKAIPATQKSGRNSSSGQFNDDNLFQNLLSAEWAIYSFYQQGVDAFSTQDFTKLGLPNTTYERIQQIRDNEAGHVRIFQDHISSFSLKPGPCKYDFRFGENAESYLAMQVLLELSSMSFLTGLIQQAKLNSTKAALVAIAETESRHNAWALIDVWNSNPFAGPSDTIYPYANQILDSTNAFIVPRTCPKENPPYPFPNQHIPTLDFVRNTTTGRPGAAIQFTFPDQTNQPHFEYGKEYHAVFFHGVNNITVPFDTTKHTSRIPKEFDQATGLILAVIASEPGAPMEEFVVAGPLVLLQQPEGLTLLV
ncbi:ferritin-like domain-containing protein [Talaromyces proteolyticus]|uniref:Ferritin-like domain-containing protein n=1 Tax=Talaromyces proteolyticus TaxID=1131652 RepID=A0AAD4PT85_9EURO|nr:ferritin-like domain-containing protein [Talaromyces proteolyticus]KAH8690339.1 ferritin-like domain-containing protein [Talaromyces proteolyticus]